MIQKLKPIYAYKQTFKVDILPLKIELFYFCTKFSTKRKKERKYKSPKNKCPISWGERILKLI